MKYQKNFEELQEIISDLESGDIGIDDLATKIKRAQKLIENCEKILTDTSDQVEKMLKKETEKE